VVRLRASHSDTLTQSQPKVFFCKDRDNDHDAETPVAAAANSSSKRSWSPPGETSSAAATSSSARKRPRREEEASADEELEALDESAGDWYEAGTTWGDAGPPVYRLLTAKTYEMHMFLSASLKLGLECAVSYSREQADDNYETNKQSSKKKNEEQMKEIDTLFKKGAYGMFRDDDDEEGQKLWKRILVRFCREMREP
jgi:hypothetical protein